MHMIVPVYLYKRRSTLRSYTSTMRSKETFRQEKFCAAFYAINVHTRRDATSDYVFAPYKHIVNSNITLQRK